MEAILAEQTRAFIYVAVLGATLGFVYDVLHAIRIMLGENKVITCVLDFLFCVLCAASFFAFTLVFMRGTVRGYCVIGCVLGGALYCFAISPFLMTAISPIALSINSIPSKIHAILKKLSDYNSKK